MGSGRPAEFAAKTTIRIEIYTTNFHVSGDVEVVRWRLAEMLNSESMPSITMQNAVREPLPELARLAGSGLARATPYLLVAKSAIIVAIPHEASDLASVRQQYLSALYTERTPLTTSAIAPPFEIRGTVHLRRVGQVKLALEELPMEFVPMSQLEGTYLLDPRLRFTAEFAVLNRPSAELFEVTGDVQSRGYGGFRQADGHPSA